MSEEKKGITVKIDAALHAEVRQYLEERGMTMGEFIALAVENELHPKMEMTEEREMGKMRTLAFQVTEELFQKIKQYLLRNNMTQKQFVIGLIEAELDREQAESKARADDVKENTTEDVAEQETAEIEEMEEDAEVGEVPETDAETEEDEDLEEDEELGEEEDESLEEDEDLDDDYEAEEQGMGMSM